MLIFPAIDVRGGQCVRLRQGDYNQETVFSADPARTAQRWVEQGARYLHIVDLDGAKQGHPVSGESVRRIVAESGVPCQLGGGLRTEDHIGDAFRWGVERVVLGTRALKDPAWLEGVCRRYPGRVVLGIDAKGGRIATDGWLEVCARSPLELARECTGLPLAALVYTDITRDGMLEGPDVEATAELVAAVTLPVIASGGISTLDDVRRLARVKAAGCIIGRALYEGRLDLAAVIKMVNEER